jgi:hypothetical protein
MAAAAAASLIIGSYQPTSVVLSVSSVASEPV